jgi:hypothetical protein
VFTILAGLVIVLKTLVQIGFAFGVGECLSGFDLLANGAISFSLQLVAAVKQVLTDRPVLGSELLRCVVHGLRVSSLTQESMQHEKIVEQNLQRKFRTHTC